MYRTLTLATTAAAAALLAAPASVSAATLDANALFPNDGIITGTPAQVDTSLASKERDLKSDRRLGQTFQVPTDAFQIDAVYVGYNSGAAGQNFTLRIYETADVFAGAANSAAGPGQVGSDLLNLSLTTPADIVTTGPDVQVLKIDLIGSEEITLLPLAGDAGYVLELNSTSGTTAFKVNYVDEGTFSFGEMVGVWSSGDKEVSDMVLALTAVPEPASLALLGLGAAMCFGRRRRA